MRKFTKYPSNYVRSDSIFAMARNDTNLSASAQFWISDYVMYGLYLGDATKFRFSPNGDSATGTRKTGTTSGYAVELKHNEQGVEDPIVFQITSISADLVHVQGGIPGVNYIHKDMDANTAIQTILNY